MGIICGPIAFLSIPRERLGYLFYENSIWVPCFVSMAAYLVGTSAVFRVLAQSDASRLSPLLGLKVIALAVIVSFMPGQQIDQKQWLAVGLCGLSAIVLQRGGSGLPLHSLSLLFVGCIFFAIADLGIAALIDGLQRKLLISRLMSGNLAMTLTYALGGIVVLPLVLSETLQRPPTSVDWRAATEYSAAWLAAMVSLYACIGAVGVVFSTILQSTRGILSVLLGGVFAYYGWHELESVVSRSTMIKRIIAAVLMTTAIAIYIS